MHLVRGVAVLAQQHRRLGGIADAVCERVGGNLPTAGAHAAGALRRPFEDLLRYVTISLRPLNMAVRSSQFGGAPCKMPTRKR